MSSVCGSITWARGAPENIIHGEPLPGLVGKPRDSAVAIGRSVSEGDGDYRRSFLRGDAIYSFAADAVAIRSV